MAKWQNDLMLDAALDYLTTNGTEYYVCTAQPIDRANAIATAVVANMTPAYSAKADGAVSGRRVTIQAESGISVTADGTATHLAICSGTALLYVTTITSQAVTTGGTINVPAWDAEIQDAA